VRKVETPEPASLSVPLPILIAAADESRDELRDIWARLRAAAVEPSHAKSFRIRFIEVAKKMDPLDAAPIATLVNSSPRRAFWFLASPARCRRTDSSISLMTPFRPSAKCSSGWAWIADLIFISYQTIDYATELEQRMPFASSACET
jgi:hypothetical protein